jgi:hypothetical protein
MNSIWIHLGSVKTLVDEELDKKRIPDDRELEGSGDDFDG